MLLSKLINLAILKIQEKTKVKIYKKNNFKKIQRKITIKINSYKTKIFILIFLKKIEILKIIPK